MASTTVCHCQKEKAAHSWFPFANSGKTEWNSAQIVSKSLDIFSNEGVQANLLIHVIGWGAGSEKARVAVDGMIAKANKTNKYYGKS
jgi:hypothetical protein